MRIIGTDVSMIRGDSEVIRVTCKDMAGAEVPFEVGDTIYFTVKRSTYTEDKIMQKVITEFVDGAALVSIFPVDTQTLRPGVYYYDIQLTRSESLVKTIIPPSKFSVNPEVTYE